jgi:hypothetical protein
MPVSKINTATPTRIATRINPSEDFFKGCLRGSGWGALSGLSFAMLCIPPASAKL